MVSRNRPKQLPEDITKPIGQDVRTLPDKVQRASDKVAIDSEHYRSMDDLVPAVFRPAPDRMPWRQGQSTAGFERKTD